MGLTQLKHWGYMTGDELMVLVRRRWGGGMVSEVVLMSGESERESARSWGEKRMG